jgi:hypothetical protein
MNGSSKKSQTDEPRKAKQRILMDKWSLYAKMVSPETLELMVLLMTKKMFHIKRSRLKIEQCGAK